MAQDGIAHIMAELKRKTGLNDKDIGKKLKVSAQTVRLWRKNDKVPDRKAEAFGRFVKSHGIGAEQSADAPAAPAPEKKQRKATNSARSTSDPVPIVRLVASPEPERDAGTDESGDILPFLLKVIEIEPGTLSLRELKWLDELEERGIEPSKSALELLRTIDKHPDLMKKLFEQR